MLIHFISNYIEYLEVERGLALNTILAYRSDLYSLAEFLQSEKIDDYSKVQRIHINMYIKNLYDKK